MKITKKALKKLIVEEIKRSLVEAEQEEVEADMLRGAEEEALRSVDKDPQVLKQKSEEAMAELPPEVQSAIQDTLKNLEAEMEKQEVDGLSESEESEARWGYKMQGGGPEQPELPGLEEEDLMQKIKDEIKEPAPEDLKTVKGWYTRKFLEDVGGGGWLGLWAGLPLAAIGAVTGGAGLAALAGAGVVALGAGIGYILGGWLKKPANAKSIHWKALEMTHSSEYDRRYQKQKEREAGGWQKQKERSQRSPYGK